MQEGRGWGQGAWLGTSNCFSRILKRTKDFTGLAWSLPFLGDKPNSILHFSLKGSGFFFGKYGQIEENSVGMKLTLSRVFTAASSACRRKER